jgi:hypothetical protein
MRLPFHFRPGARYKHQRIQIKTYESLFHKFIQKAALIPLGLKPLLFRLWAAWLKPCPFKARFMKQAGESGFAKGMSDERVRAISLA